MTDERRTVGNDDYGAFARRILTAYAKRVGSGDVAALADLVRLRDDLDAALDSAVAALRSEPNVYSWADVASALGVTRQAAMKRWRHVDPGLRKPGGQPGRLR